MTGEIAEDFLDAVEEGVTGSFDPVAVHGGLFVGGDGPEGFEAAEVIKANHVVERERAADARDPPVKAALFEQAPLVERIAPALAGGGEVVGRNSRDACGSALLVELKDFGVSPDVGGVVADEDGDVAEDFDLALDAVGAEGVPLLGEEELDDLLDGDVAAGVVQERGHGIGLAEGVFGRPVDPAGVVEAAAEDGEHGPIGEPGDVVLSEALEAGALLAVGALEEVCGGLFDERALGIESALEVARAVVAGETLNAVRG